MVLHFSTPCSSAVWGRGLRVGFDLFGVLNAESFWLLAIALWKFGGSKRGI